MFELGKEIVVADMDGFGLTSAGDDEATGSKLIARMLDDAILFAGNEGFVDFDGSLFHLAVYNDLIAEGVN